MLHGKSKPSRRVMRGEQIASSYPRCNSALRNQSQLSIRTPSQPHYVGVNTVTFTHPRELNLIFVPNESRHRNLNHNNFNHFSAKINYLVNSKFNNSQQINYRADNGVIVYNRIRLCNMLKVYLI